MHTTEAKEIGAKSRLVMEHKIELSYWKKGMTVKCPECHSKVKEPYTCKCGAILKPFVKIKF